MGMCRGRKGSILSLSPFISMFKAFPSSCWEEAGQLAVGQEPGAPSCSPLWGWGMLSCSLSPAPGSPAGEEKRSSSILKSLKYGKE